MNKGLTYDDSAEYTARQSKIVMRKYRQFALQHPDQTTYYQPILDVLSYRPSNLELALPAIFFEGKNDSYTLGLAALQRQFSQDWFCLMPGTGSGNLDDVIRLYLGWGRPFIVILDSDREGKKQKTRYENIFGLAVDNKVFTLSDFSDDFAGKGLEKLIPNEEQLAIQLKCYPDQENVSKSLLNRSLQELLQKGDNRCFSDKTCNALSIVLKGAIEALKVQFPNAEK